MMMMTMRAFLASSSSREETHVRIGRYYRPQVDT